MIDQDRLNKLPKFVRDEITDLRHEIASLREIIDSISKDHQGTNVFIRDLPNMERRGLPPGEVIEFNLGNDPTWSGIDVSIRDGRLILMGHQSLRLYPRAANVVEIDFTP